MTAEKGAKCLFFGCFNIKIPYNKIMQVKLDDAFVVWYRITNPHVFVKGTKAAERKKELTEYVNDVLMEHMESMNDLLEDDSPDSGFMEQ